MGAASPIKPNHKAVRTYYDALRTYARQEVDDESAVCSAFQNLLDDLGRHVGWTLIAKGCPLGNTIFEDTRRGYLYQNGQLAMKADALADYPGLELVKRKAAK